MDNTALLATQIGNKTIGYFGQYMNLARTVARDWDYDVAGEGEAVTIGRRGALTSNTKGINDDVVVQSPAATGATVTLDTHEEVTVDLKDAMRAKQAKRLDIVEGYAMDAAKVLVEAVEAKLAALYADLTNDAVVFDTTSLATKKASLLALRRAFVTNKVPKSEPRWLYLGTEGTTAILEEDSFTRADAVGQNQTLEQGQIARPLYGFNPFESQAVVETEDDGDVTEHGIAYTKDAFVLATRPLEKPDSRLGVISNIIVDPETGVALRTVMTYNGSKLAQQLTIDILFGVKVLDQRRAVPFTTEYTPAA